MKLILRLLKCYVTGEKTDRMVTVQMFYVINIFHSNSGAKNKRLLF